MASMFSKAVIGWCETMKRDEFTLCHPPLTQGMHCIGKNCLTFGFALSTYCFPYLWLLLLLLTFSPTTEQSIFTFYRIVAAAFIMPRHRNCSNRKTYFLLRAANISRSMSDFTSLSLSRHHDMAAVFLFSLSPSVWRSCEQQNKHSVSVPWVVNIVKCNGTGVVAKSHQLHKIRMSTDWEEQRAGREGRGWLNGGAMNLYTEKPQ